MFHLCTFVWNIDFCRLFCVNKDIRIFNLLFDNNKEREWLICRPWNLGNMLFLDNIAHKETWMSIKRTIFLLHCCTGVVSSSNVEVTALLFGMILAVFCFHFGRVQLHTAPPTHTHTHTNTHTQVSQLPPASACSHHDSGGSRRLVKCYTRVPRKANRRTLRF